MNTLAEIEAAVDSLPSEEKQELFLYLVSLLRSSESLPAPREFTREQLDAWINEDEQAMKRFLEEC